MQLRENASALRNFSALVDFSNLINSSLELKFALNNLLLTCLGKFQATKGIVALVNDQNYLEIQSSKGISTDVLEKMPDILIRDIEKSNEFNDFLNQNNFPISQKIISSNGIIGIVILGPRLIQKPYDEEDEEFLRTLSNIGATAIENSLFVEKLKKVNRDLDAKLNQLSSLFDLSKEFSSILEIQMISKLLVFSIIGQLLVSKYSIIICKEKDFDLLDSKLPELSLRTALESFDICSIVSPIYGELLNEKFEKLIKLGVKLIVPMQIKSETRGLIILGSRVNNQSYSKSDIEFVSSLGSIAIISIENSKLFKETLEKQRMEKDLEIAKNIQRNLLPDKVPELAQFEIAAYNKAARQIGGDYYDIVKLSNEKTLVAIADVSGKGVQAALLMANLQAFLKSICKQNIELNEASNLINDLVSENTTMGSFITFFWGVLNEKTKEIVSVNAGHNPPLLLRDGEIIKLKNGGMILGVMATIEPYISERIQLQTDDTIILFTDGITEAMNSEDNEYGDERLENLVLKNGNKSAKELLDLIISDVKEFVKDAEQSDDITALIIKVK